MKGITIAATLLCLAGGASYFKADNNSKPLALNIALISAAVATTNYLSSKFTEDAIKLQAKDSHDNLKSEIQTLTMTNKKYQSGIDEIKKIYDLQNVKLAETQKAVEVYESQIRNIKDEYKSKSNDLNLKLQEDDTRFLSLVIRFKKALCDDLRERIDTIYNNLDKSIEHKLTKQLEDGSYEYEKIFPSLQNLKDTLAHKFIEHCDWLKEIASMPTDDVIIDAVQIYAQVCDEIIALKVRYRNVLNIDVQRSLQDAYETLGGYTKHYTPKQKAVDALRELNNESTNKFENLKAKIDDNDNSLLEMREQVSDLLDQIDLGNLKIDKLQEQIAQFKLPHQFIGGVEQPIAGNAIANYYFKLGYTLDGSDWELTETGYTLHYYKDRNDRFVDLEILNSENHPDKMKEFTNSLNRPEFKQSTRSSRIYLEVQKSYPVKKTLSESDINSLVGNPQEFVKYITSHPVRYRLIADPGVGKTPTTAVMISEIIKVGCTKGNTGKGEKVPHTLVTVSYPDAESSQKDADYPLQSFLQYGNTTASVKSFDDCLADGKYRSHNTKYASEFFHIWVWDEFDNTVNSADDPKGTGENIKHILKQFGHKNIGWIVSGQSVMTKQLPGFMNDDRTLFTEIIIGTAKIRKYLKTYGSEALSESIVDTLKINLEKIDSYVQEKNNQITDDARLLRVALVLDSRSPKLYFLPNLDSVDFDYKAIEDTRKLSEDYKRQTMSNQSDMKMVKFTDDSQNSIVVSIDQIEERSSFPPIGGSSQNDHTAHCPHCGSSHLKLYSDKRYGCNDCKKRFVESKVVWK